MSRSLYVAQAHISSAPGQWDDAISRGQLLRNWVKGPSALRSDLGFDRFGLRCLQLKTLNNHPVAADRVVVAAELDIFSRNMNNPAERLSDRQNSMNSREPIRTRLNRKPRASIAQPDSRLTDHDAPVSDSQGRAVTERAARPPRTARSASQHLPSAQPRLFPPSTRRQLRRRRVQATRTQVYPGRRRGYRRSRGGYPLMMRRRASSSMPACSDVRPFAWSCRRIR